MQRVTTRLWQNYFRHVDPLLKRFSLIGRGPLWRSEALPWLAQLEAAHEQVNAEFRRYVQSGMSMPDKEDLDPGRTSRYGTDRWELLHLLVYGERMPDVAEHFPETVKLAESIVPGMCSIMFSRLPPERHQIPRHRDAENGTLRIHLGLVVPEHGACFINVGDATAHWRVGEAFVMDATYEHEVTKEANAERIVLIVDFYRPVPGWVAWLTHRLYRRHGGKIAKRVLRASYAKRAQQQQALVR
ncbi:aspartyl/asparaginyl beta-hydroxylase domain-containing protein [Tahibacter sp.]|uniref:aspartyl/asparaginyl beta-hydroxylase domain-containing protein n=1 Tax=Tahibacter sp. TaxID=2056211 RepID=UPI0028C4B101|nr:aspartyl/asparaginyl beta-hydroxylase domain-containing protein [Tahibacter sp.]